MTRGNGGGHGAPWIVYGATGFTGELVVREAVRRGHKPVVAGRNLDKVRALAHAEGCPYAAFPSDDVERIRTAIRGAPLVMHCAGPFVHTAAAMREACLAEGAHYLDITGEISVFEGSFALDERAKERAVCIMSGVGFDVVPTDCLAKYVADAVPGATRLEIAFCGLGGGVSAGTTKSALEHMGKGGAIRRGGRLEAVPPMHEERRVRFSDGKERAVVAIPWGDLVTAWESTHVPDIVVYASFPPSTLRVMRHGAGLLAAGMKSTFVRAALMGLVEKWVHGPSPDQQRTGRSYIWAKASGPGGTKEAWLETAEGYHFTALASVRAVERMLAEQPRGALTPSVAFGADFVLEIEGSERFDSLPG